VSIALFLVALIAGAALLAVWFDVRFPALAPQRLKNRVVVAAIAFVFVATAPISPAGGLLTLATLLGVFLPALCFALLTSLWLLRSLAQARSV